MSIEYQDRLLKLASYLDEKAVEANGVGNVSLTTEEVTSLVDLLRILANEVFNKDNPSADPNGQIQAAVLERLNNYQAILQQVETVMEPFAQLHMAIKLATRTQG